MIVKHIIKLKFIANWHFAEEFFLNLKILPPRMLGFESPDPCLRD